MVTILTEPAYSESMWCKALYGSLTERLRQKRIPFCEMYDNVPVNSEAVFIHVFQPLYFPSVKI